LYTIPPTTKGDGRHWLKQDGDKDTNNFGLFFHQLVTFFFDAETLQQRRKTCYAASNSSSEKIAEQAVEKDWWVSTILMALTKTSWADFLQF